MPYISIQSFPKDEETKERIVEKINEAFLEVWGCPQRAISISMEEVDPADWQEKVLKAQIEPNMDKMRIVQGEKVK